MNGWCRVTATITHPPSGDSVKVWIGLPVTNWNGRFRGNGGGGYSGGSAGSLRGPVAQGYVAGATDTGHEGGSGSFALDANGRLNWQAIQRSVQQRMGGAEKTAQFARLFLAPGVDHGFRGAGATPTGQMEALVRWVEDGQAPDKLLAERRDSA